MSTSTSESSSSRSEDTVMATTTDVEPRKRGRTGGEDDEKGRGAKRPAGKKLMRAASEPRGVLMSKAAQRAMLTKSSGGDVELARMGSRIGIVASSKALTRTLAASNQDAPEATPLRRSRPEPKAVDANDAHVTLLRDIIDFRRHGGLKHRPLADASPPPPKEESPPPPPPPVKRSGDSVPNVILERAFSDKRDERRRLSLGPQGDSQRALAALNVDEPLGDFAQKVRPPTPPASRRHTLQVPLQPKRRKRKRKLSKSVKGISAANDTVSAATAAGGSSASASLSVSASRSASRSMSRSLSRSPSPSPARSPLSPRSLASSAHMDSSDSMSEQQRVDIVNKVLADDSEHIESSRIKPVTRGQVLDYELKEARTTLQQIDKMVVEKHGEETRQLLDDAAAAAAGGPVASGDYDASLGRTRTLQERAKVAALYVKAAVDGRTVYRAAETLPRSQVLYTHTYTGRIMQVIAFLHMLVMLAEPPTNAGVYFEERSFALVKGLQVFEFVCCLAYIVEMVYRVNRFASLRKFARLWFNDLLCVCIACLFIDSCVALFTTTSYRFSRPLRAIVFLLYSLPFRRLISIVLRTLPFIVDVLALAIFLQVIFAIVGVQLFQGMYVDEHGERLDDNFDNIGRAMISLSVLVTTENYPDVMYPSIFHPVEGTWWNAIFFILFVLINVFIIVSIVTAVAFNVFMEQFRHYVVRQKVKERRNLLTAFMVLDHTVNGEISLDDFMELWSVLALGGGRARKSRKYARAVFTVLDRDRSHSLDVFEFFRITDVFLLRFKEFDEEAAALEERRRRQVWSLTAMGRFRLRLATIVRHRFFSVAIFVLIVLNTASLCALAGAPGISDEWRTALEVADQVVLAVFIAEVLVKVMALTWRSYWRDRWNRFDFVLVLLSIVFLGLEQLVKLASGVSSDESTGAVPTILRLFRLGRLVRSLRLLAVADRIRVLTATFVRMTPILYRVFGLLLVLFYVYASVGMDLFAQQQLFGGVSFTDGGTGFDSVWRAALSVFQLLTTSNWHEMMYASINATGNSFVALYYISFFYIVILILLNLLLALMLETFAVQREVFHNKHPMLLEVLSDRNETNDFGRRSSIVAGRESASASRQSNRLSRPHGRRTRKEKWVIDKKPGFDRELFSDVFRAEDGSDMLVQNTDVLQTRAERPEHVKIVVERAQRFHRDSLRDPADAANGGGGGGGGERGSGGGHAHTHGSHVKMVAADKESSTQRYIMTDQSDDVWSMYFGQSLVPDDENSEDLVNLLSLNPSTANSSEVSLRESDAFYADLPQPAPLSRKRSSYSVRRGTDSTHQRASSGGSRRSKRGSGGFLKVPEQVHGGSRARRRRKKK